MVFGVFLRTCVNTLGKPTAVCRNFPRTAHLMAKIGDQLPPMELSEGNPANKVNILDLCKGKKVVIFAVPGAFTPACSTTHVPGYLNHHDMIKSKGFSEIICISVNDPFVMDAWAKSQQTEGKIRMLADPDGAFTRALNLQTEIPPLGGLRSKRYAMVVEDGIIRQLHVEPDGTGLTCSLANRLPI